MIKIITVNEEIKFRVSRLEDILQRLCLRGREGGKEAGRQERWVVLKAGRLFAEREGFLGVAGCRGRVAVYGFYAGRNGGIAL